VRSLGEDPFFFDNKLTLSIFWPPRMMTLFDASVFLIFFILIGRVLEAYAKSRVLSLFTTLIPIRITSNSSPLPISYRLGTPSLFSELFDLTKLSSLPRTILPLPRPLPTSTVSLSPPLPAPSTPSLPIPKTLLSSLLQE